MFFYDRVHAHQLKRFTKPKQREVPYPWILCSIRCFLLPTTFPKPGAWAPRWSNATTVGGQLRRWDGPLATVRSPVWLKEGDEERQVILGSAPLLDADTALTALDAAVQAYDKGRGTWPTLRVAERIQHVEAFRRACASSARRWSSC